MEASEHFFQVQKVTIEIRGEHNYIIQIYQQRLIDQVPQAVLYQPLECGWSVTEAERHLPKLIKAGGSRKSSFLSIGGIHLHLPVTTWLL